MARIKYWDEESQTWKYADKSLVNGSNIKIDPTLSIAGAAADAKAVGDAINQHSGGNADNISPAIYVVDFQNPNYEEAVAAYDAGRVLVMTNITDETYGVSPKDHIYFSEYYTNETYPTLNSLRFKGFLFSTPSGYMEVIASVNSSNTATAQVQPIRHYLNKQLGGTMSAPLILNADPVEDLEASTKRYVDNSIAAMNVDIHPLTFTGAVNATYDGSEAVSVEIPQGGGDTDELLLDFVTTEEVSQIDIPLTGISSKINNAAQLKLYIKINLPSADDGTDLGKVSANFFRTWVLAPFFADYQKSPSNSKSWITYSEILAVMTKSKIEGLSMMNSIVSNFLKNSGNHAKVEEKSAQFSNVNDTDTLRITSTLPMGVGTIVKLYARGIL